MQCMKHYSHVAPMIVGVSVHARVCVRACVHASTLHTVQHMHAIIYSQVLIH